MRMEQGDVSPESYCTGYLLAVYKVGEHLLYVNVVMWKYLFIVTFWRHRNT